METKWSMINNINTINLLDGLLRGEAISQVKNNYGISKITNPIAEIRNEIGFDSIHNYRKENHRWEEYKLFQSKAIVNKVLQLKKRILSNLENKNKKHPV